MINNVTTVAQHLIKTLVELDIATFFGVPGGPVCPLFEAIRTTPGAKLIESRHENHAAWAAATYYKATSKIPVVIVTSGPGITNVVSGVASAHLERIPMLVIAGDVAWNSTTKVLAQNSGPEGIDAEQIFKSITKIQVRASTPESVVLQTLGAINVAKSTYDAGPALLVLSIDVAMKKLQPHDDLEDAKRLLQKNKIKHQTIEKSKIDQIAKLLYCAKHPLIVLGGGCINHEKNLLKMINKLKLPFVTTPRAKGVISELHEYSLRNCGMAASEWAKFYTSLGIDVCLVLGTDIDDTSMGATPFLCKEGKLIHVDLNPNVFNRNILSELCVCCDIGEFAESMSKNEIQFDNQHIHHLMKDVKSKQIFSFTDSIDCNQVDLVDPHKFLINLQSTIKEKYDATYITDIGEHMLFALHCLTIQEPNKFHIQLNLGSMGSGISGAIGLGLSIKKKNQLVVCIAGDGGMQMSGMEALVALKENLPILFVVFNDGRYNMVHHGMKQIFGQAQQYDMPMIDFVKWSESFGMQAKTIKNVNEINVQMIEGLMKDRKPALLDVKIDPSVRVKGGGRVEALQHMSMLSQFFKGDK